MCNAAIVCTLRSPGESIISFVKYHLHIGFDYIFLFFDDPQDTASELVRKNEKVIVIKNDSELQNEWKKTNLYTSQPEYHQFIKSEVMARQMLNVEVAKEMAFALNIRWLLHIDSDELLYLENQNLKDHLADLDRAGVSSMAYLNHEAIPTQTSHSDCFKEITIFKKNAALLSEAQLNLLNTFKGRFYFHYYANGKSIGKVSNLLLPDSVHRFKYHNENDKIQSPCILHYAICSFDSFLKKYNTLGLFDEKWFGIFDINKLVPFHIKARDIVSKNNIATINKFYKKEVLQPKNKIDVLLRNNIYIIIEQPSLILRELQ